MSRKKAVGERGTRNAIKRGNKKVIERAARAQHVRLTSEEFVTARTLLEDGLSARDAVQASRLVQLRQRAGDYLSDNHR